MAEDPWFMKRDAVRIAVRTFVLFIAGLMVLSPRVLATCAWVVVPLSAFEFWVVARWKPTIRIGLLGFVVATGLLLAAYFQAVHAAACLRAQSFDVGLQAVEHELGRLFGHSMAVVVLVFVVQCQALACAIAPLRSRSKETTLVLLATWLTVVTVAPTIDWLLLSVIEGKALSRELGEVGLGPTIMISTVMLAMGSVFATVALFGLYWLIDLFSSTPNRSSRTLRTWRRWASSCPCPA